MWRGHKKTKYLFNPRITEEWREGWTLVVGINHWCTVGTNGAFFRWTPQQDVY